MVHGRIESIAQQIYTHHKDALTLSRSGKSCLLFGIYPLSWRQLEDTLSLYESPVKWDADFNPNSVTLNLLRNELKSLFVGDKKV